MDNSARRTRFEARVALERLFLTPVNGRFGATAPLAGMTREAIASWQQRALHFCGAVRADLIASILTEASMRAELLADNSKDVFEADDRPQPDSLDELKELLNQTLTAEA